MRNALVQIMICSVALLGCSSLSTSPRSTFQLKAYQTERLENGLEILWIQDKSLPRISLNMMFSVGSIDESNQQAGVNSLLVSLLDQGSDKLSARQISDSLAEIGAEYGATGGQDFTNLQISGLSPYRAKVAEIFAEIVLRPGLADKEIERRRSLLIANLEKTQDQPSAFADELLDQSIFGSHPYARPQGGLVGVVKKLKKSDLRQHYESFYRPNNAVLAVVGQFDESFKPVIRDLFSRWNKGQIPISQRQTPTVKEGRTILYSKADLQQTQIRFGHLGIKRSNPDFMALRMANVVLGGAFASRLNQHIRDDLGLTYSISSASDARLDLGSFEISTFTRHEKVAETVLETKKMLKTFVEEGVTEAELDAAKALLIGQFPAALETPDRFAFNLMVLRRYGISDSYLSGFQNEVTQMTRARVNAVIQKYIHPQQFQTVIYSDEKGIGAQIEKLGPVVKQESKVQ